ncbi:MAG: hypothetical protein GF368_02565 [Candidatus Aenigmarchaeota archaeon]|nr:hypothetical protein [Candidatus Aenigmarchaeota archaeon]
MVNIHKLLGMIRSGQAIMTVDPCICPEDTYDCYVQRSDSVICYSVDRRTAHLTPRDTLPYGLGARDIGNLRPELVSLGIRVFTKDDAFRLMINMPHEDYIG